LTGFLKLGVLGRKKGHHRHLCGTLVDDPESASPLGYGGYGTYFKISIGLKAMTSKAVGIYFLTALIFFFMGALGQTGIAGRLSLHKALYVKAGEREAFEGGDLAGLLLQGL